MRGDEQALVSHLRREVARRAESRSLEYMLGFADCVHVVEQWLLGPSRDVRLVSPRGEDGQLLYDADAMPEAAVAYQESLHDSKIVRAPDG